MTPDVESEAILRCSERSQDEPLTGSAPTTARWWLIEDPGPWGSHAVRDSPLPWIARCASVPGHLARTLLIRKHDGPHHRRDDAGRRILTFAPGDDVVHSRTINAQEDPGIEDFSQPPDDPSWQRTTDHPLLLVCTNGRRDRCCAERGRAILDALPDEIIDQVWECTHIGGHRFAPVGLTVPDGVVLGRLTRESIISTVGSRRYDLSTIRGRSDLSAPAQVAELSARRRWGTAGTGVRLDVDVTSTPDAPAVTIEVTGPSGEAHTATVRSRERDSILASCGALETSGVVWEEED